MSPETLAVGRVGPPLSRLPSLSIPGAIPQQITPPSQTTSTEPSPVSPPPPPQPCEDDSGDGKGVLVEGSDCASYLLFPGCDSDLHDLFGTSQSPSRMLRYDTLRWRAPIPFSFWPLNFGRILTCACTMLQTVHCTVCSIRGPLLLTSAPGLAIAALAKIRCPLHSVLAPMQTQS